LPTNYRRQQRRPGSPFMGGWARGDDCDCDCNILPTIQQAGLPSCRHNGCGRGMHACILMIGAASIDASETHQHHEERNNLGGLRTDRQCWSPPARAPPTSNIMIVAPGLISYSTSCCSRICCAAQNGSTSPRSRNQPISKVAASSCGYETSYAARA